MKWRAGTLAALCLTRLAAAQPMPATVPSTMPSLDAAPYDALWASLGTYLDPADPFDWPAKVRAIDRSPYHFWRGTRDLFYAWCRTHCADWAGDKDADVVSQGDLHWGNLGAYAARPFGTVAYGLVDFDDSARLPFELELLQGVVTFDLIARQNGIALPPERRRALHAALLDAYADALTTPTAATGLPDLLPPRPDAPYRDDLTHFVQHDRFRARVVNKRGEVTDLLRPIASDRRPALAAALAEAVSHDTRLAALLRLHTAGDFRDAVLDAVVRTRLGSSGSQGLSKVLVLLRRPFKGQDGDGLLYLKQQVPSAAERAGLVPFDARPPGERCAADLDALTHGQSLAASWCAWEGRSYWVSVKEPWSEEPDDKGLSSFDALTHAAVVWSRVLADAHRDDAPRLAVRLTPALRQSVSERAEAFERWQAGAYARFHADPRTAADVARFNAAAEAIDLAR